MRGLDQRVYGEAGQAASPPGSLDMPGTEMGWYCKTEAPLIYLLTLAISWFDIYDLGVSESQAGE